MTDTPGRRERRITAVALVFVAIAATTGFLIGRATDDAAPAVVESPSSDSIEAGFARDMAVHHAQAVAMAELIRARSADPDLELMAKDTVLTQQAQIGIMRGWLEVWGLPATDASVEPMGWMGMTMGDTMPGMATRDDLDALSTLPAAEAEVRYLQLMIRHHQGGVEMAEHVTGDVEAPVKRLARSIIDAQTAEIAAMRDMLATREVTG